MPFLGKNHTKAGEREYTVAETKLNPAQIKEVKKLNLREGTFICFAGDELISYSDTLYVCLAQATDRIFLKDVKDDSAFRLTGQLELGISQKEAAVVAKAAEVNTRFGVKR